MIVSVLKGSGPAWKIIDLAAWLSCISDGWSSHTALQAGAPFLGQILTGDDGNRIYKSNGYF